MADVTAIVLTLNEEANLEACLRSVEGFCARVVVIDSGSSDRTLEIAGAYGADIYEHPFTYYAAQYNWGVDNANITTKWTLRLDADERFTPEVCKACESQMAEHDADEVNGIVLESDFFFLGRQMKHGGSKKRKIMLFKTGKGRIEDRKRDAHTILLEGTAVSIRERYLHYDFKDLTSYIARYNWYAIRELSDYIEYENGASYDANTDERLRRHRKKKFTIYYRAPMFLRAWLWFVYNYYFRLGFLDGKEGYLYHYFESYWYRFLVDAKIYEYRKTGRAAEELRALGK
ncbi:MAG: glycosyltransferase family 2 protein [Eubacteriales bacterium]|nr:glycosyltransferase family 2 protein [Eubacteriales bacterium]